MEISHQSSEIDINLIVNQKENISLSIYSCPHLVRPKSEELISRPFVGEIQFQLVLLKRMGTESAIGCLFFIHQALLFCPTHAHSIREDMGVYSRICSDAG